MANAICIAHQTPFRKVRIVCLVMFLATHVMGHLQFNVLLAQLVNIYTNNNA
jgi:hypothetical protein